MASCSSFLVRLWSRCVHPRLRPPYRTKQFSICRFRFRNSQHSNYCLPSRTGGCHAAAVNANQRIACVNRTRISLWKIGKLSPGWTLLSAGVLGVALGMPISNAEYDPHPPPPPGPVSCTSGVIARVWLIDSSQMHQFMFPPFFIHDSHVPSCRYYTGC